MSTPFIGQIQPFGLGFAPRNWALCNGQTLSIQQNSALFALLGTMYGGNGVNTFLLPNLQSRVPMHAGSFSGTTYVQGEVGGTEQASLSINNMPGHTHTFQGTATADDPLPSAGTALANIGKAGGGTGNPYYGPDTTPQPINPGALTSSGGNQPHTNLQPYLVINWCIALSGIFPSRN